MKPQLIDAVLSLVPGAEVSVVGDHVTWISPENSPVSITEISAEHERLIADYELSSYKRLRAAEYPPIAEYIDAIVKDDKSQMDAYISKCKAIKEKYPKPD